MQPGPVPYRPVADEAKLKRAKILRGCGGCGCLFALLLGITSGVLIFFGSQEATKEAMPFGLIASVFTGIISIIGLVFLIIGIMKVKSAQQG